MANISIPCRVTETHDVAIVIDGRIPYFSDYRLAYDFLYSQGYSYDRDSGPGCVVLDMPIDKARLLYGDLLQPYSQLRNRGYRTTKRAV